MKSFGWILFLAFLVMVSCAVAGSVKEGFDGPCKIYGNSQRPKQDCFKKTRTYTLQSGDTEINVDNTKCVCRKN